MTKQTLGDAPIQEKYRAMMNAVAQALDTTFNGDAKGVAKETGFVLMLFPYGDVAGARCNYISNGADRSDVVILMKEMIARFEGQPEITGRA